MPLQVVRRWAYRWATVLALAYAAYVLVLKFLGRVMGGPLGEVGEFALVLLAVLIFAVGLFADEALRRRAAPPAGVGVAGPEV